MKGKHYDYIFLLVIVVIGLLGGLLMQPQRESFLNLKQNYNSCRRHAEKSVESFRESMFGYYRSFLRRK